MIDKEHGTRAVIAACGLAVITAAGLYAVNAGAGAGTQTAPAAQEQSSSEESSCREAQEEAQNATEESGAEQQGFEDREVPVFRETDAEEKITLRFYEDLPSVAYVKIEDYHHLFFPEEVVTVAQEGNGTGVYTVTNGSGSARIDTEKETILSEDILAFTNVMGLVQPGMCNGYLDGVPYVRWAYREVTPAQAPTEFDLAEYGIDLRADGSGLYLPMATLSDLYADLSYHFAFYDGTKVYMEDENIVPHYFMRDGEYRDTVFADETRPADLAAFTYGELCFAIDHFYGRPERVALDGAIEEKGLDKALEGLGEEGARVRELLQSTDKAEYLAGLKYIGTLLYDGGHTMINPAGLLSSRMPETMWDKYDAAGNSIALLSEMNDENRDGMVETLNNAKVKAKQRADVIGEGITYFRKGDTAICVFDSFMPDDVKAFEPYLRGETDQMPEGDPMTIFIDALAQAKKDPEVKNFVVDISVNGGGSLDLVMALEAMLTGENEGSLTYKNLLTGQTITDHYAVDVNMDGRFDEEDRVPCDLNVAILTSDMSFSCGNLFPAIMKDKGFMILGEQSGGGSCAIQCMATADGFWYQMSSARMHLADQDGSDLDAGVPVDVPLLDSEAQRITTQIYGTVVREDGSTEQGETEWTSIDYSGLYDPDRISEEISSFYGEDAEELVPAA